VTLGLGLGCDPVAAFIMVGTGIVIVLAAIYILMNVACIGYFARQRSRWNPLSHVIIPLLGIAAFVPAWLTAAGIKAFSLWPRSPRRCPAWARASRGGCCWASSTRSTCRPANRSE
jgi:hypothetical protein